LSRPPDIKGKKSHAPERGQEYGTRQDRRGKVWGRGRNFQVRLGGIGFSHLGKSGDLERGNLQKSEGGKGSRRKEKEKGVPGDW